MDDGLKQRLVGAVVLVAIAVIFIPMIFSDAKLTPEDIKVTIPPKPQPPVVEIKMPEKPKTPKPEKQAVVQEESNGQVDDKHAEILPESWSLQLASFQERDNADALRDKLRASGYKAYVQFRPHEKPALARVFVGPELDRARIDKYKSDLHKQFKLEGIVVRFMDNE